MPVPKSRSRGKKSRSTRSAAHRTRDQRSSASFSPGLPLGLFQIDPEISARRERLARRTAQEELPALLDVVGRYASDPGEREDRLCARLGELMHRCDADGASDPDRSRYLEPDRVLSAVTAAVIEALGAPGEVPQTADFEPGGALAAPWRLWEVLREIAPDAQAHALYGLEEELRSRLAAPLPESSTRRALADSLLWACDGYRSRFLITAAFERAGQVRSYAWDVDACGYEAVTVAAGFFSSSESAFEQWRSAVGADATATSALAPVEDDAQRRLVAALLPDVEGFGRMGGESVEQMAEYHRSRRLAQSLRATPGLAQASPASEDDPRPELQQRHATRFADWLAARKPERDLAFDIGGTRRRTGRYVGRSGTGGTAPHLLAASGRRQDPLAPGLLPGGLHRRTPYTAPVLGALDRRADGPAGPPPRTLARILRRPHPPGPGPRRARIELVRTLP